MTCPDCGAETYPHRILSLSLIAPSCVECSWLGIGSGDARRSFVEGDR